MAIFSCYYFILVISCSLFLVQLVNIWIDYHQGNTAIGTRGQEVPFKLLPCLTICPLPAYKNTNISDLAMESSLESYLAATYGCNDTFSPRTLKGEGTSYEDIK